MPVEINNKTKSHIELHLVKKTVEKFLEYYNLERKNVSIAFVGDKTIKLLNKKYRNKDSVTDVLTFANNDDFGVDSEDSLGEIVIDYQQIKRQAKEFSKTPSAELIFILVHGLLHLLGYNDETEEARIEMINLGENFIAKL